MNIGKDNNMNEIWGYIVDVISKSGLVSSNRSKKRTGMWTTRLCKSNQPLEDIGLNDFKIIRRKIDRH